MSGITLEYLIDKLAKLKQREQELKDERIACETDILTIASIDPNKEGSTTLDRRLRVVGKMTRDIDEQALRELITGGHESICEFFTWEPKLKLAEYRKATDSQRALLAKVVTTRPAKPSFTLL